MGFLFGLAIGLAIPMFWPKLFTVIHEKVLEVLKKQNMDIKND